MRHLGITSAIAIFCSATGSVLAQPATPSPNAPTAIPEKTAPGTAPHTNLDQQSGTLSDKLNDTNGVIAPTQPTDPGMQKPAPQTGTMPVIKPGDVGGGAAK